MTINLDMETRWALVDELKKYIPIGEQKRVTHAVAKALGKKEDAGESRLSRLLHKREDVIEFLLGPDRAETVLGAICNELKLDMDELVRAAKKAAGQRPRPAPDRHPAWQEFGEAAPWVDKVPGLQAGTETLRQAISAYGQRVVWLVGPAGSGKSARLWRAQQAKIGRLVTDPIPDEAEPDAVWLIDEPDNPDAWIAGAARCKARLVVATRVARQPREGQSKLELLAWTRAEAENFLGQLGDARFDQPGDALAAVVAALATVDFEHVADKLAVVSGGWTPLDLGHLIRLLVDDQQLLQLDANDRELRIRSAMHGLLRRAELSYDDERLWSERGRRAYALAAAEAVRGSAAGHPIGPIGEAALREALAEVAGVTVGGGSGEPLRAIIDRARREAGETGETGETDKSRKGAKRSEGNGRDKGSEHDKVTARQILQKLETWARSPSSDDLIELLVELGAWRRVEGGTFAPTDEKLALTVAAECLDDDWMWRRLRDTLVDRNWAVARIAWAPCLGRVEERIDELLATDAAAHVGAIELAVALIAFSREVPRPDQIEHAVCSAARLLECHMLTRIGLSPIPALQDVVRSASRRHHRLLPQVTTALTRQDLEERCTDGTRRVVRVADRLAEDGPEWLRGPLMSGLRGPLGTRLPEWVSYAVLMPWQALPALQEPAGRQLLGVVRFDWEAALMDHAADGHPWARAVATGDVEHIQETCELVSSRGLLRALSRWPAPSDPQRHEQALMIVLNRLSYGNDAARSRLHTEVVRTIIDFVRRQPEHPLPNLWWLQRHEALWREALNQAAAVNHLRTWFDSERQELAHAVTDDFTMSSHLEATPSRLPPAITANIERLLRLGEVLHRHGVPAPLSEFLEQAESPPRFDRTCVAWELGVGAADALLRLRDAASLRSLREPYGSARYGAISNALDRKNHDEETVLWIADHLGARHDEVLESIIGRPERREVAKRWALDASASFRRHASARWLLSHPVAGEHEHVRWLLTELPVEHSLHYVKPALAHPDETVRAAALTLLPRVLEELGADADLASVARSFFDRGRADDDTSFAITMGLERYLNEVNTSGHACSSESIHTLIELTQRYLATASDEQVRSVANVVCSSLATAARHLRLASLAAWVRDPLGAYADVSTSPSRIEDVRAGIISGILPFGENGADLDSEVLQAVAATENPRMTFQAHSLLLEREARTEAQLLAEWGAVSDAVLVERERASARFYAVQEQLGLRAPRTLARALADRLLALPPEMRRHGVSQISQVAMLDAGQAARLSPLFD